MFLIYSFLYTLVISFLLLPEFLKRPPELRRKWFRERVGYLPEADSAIWVHAVSVGEINACLPFLDRLRELYPGMPLVVSTITDTGQRIAMTKAPPGTAAVYLPFDIPCILERSLRRLKPKIFVTIETELWPNLFRALSRHSVPVLVLNGRLSATSARGYKRLAFFMKKVLAYVETFAMQGPPDAARLKDIGVREDKVTVIGNFKFDMRVPQQPPSWAKGLHGRVVLAGSTHRGEEELIFQSYIDNLTAFPDLKLVVAPRHPERFREVEDMLRSSPVSFVKKSDLDGQPGAFSRSGKNVLLLDTVGELAAAYGAADIVIIGKSFIGSGGQNPLEAACWGKAIICGPHMENFPFMEDFLQRGAAFRVEISCLSKKIKELIVSPEKAEAAGAKARELFLENSGAVDKAVKIVQGYLG